jgi:hypothetical protein
VAKQCRTLWNFPHSLGAMMGNVWCYGVQEILPVNTLTTKYTLSIARFAVVDANYNFIHVGYMSTRDIGEEFLRAVFLRTLSCIKN